MNSLIIIGIVLNVISVTIHLYLTIKQEGVFTAYQLMRYLGALLVCCIPYLAILVYIWTSIVLHSTKFKDKTIWKRKYK